MGGSGVKEEVFRRTLCASFERPADFPKLIDQHVSRSRTLRSSDRKELVDLLYDSIRWRRRIWGDIAPTSIDFELLSKRFTEARSFKTQPPLSRWSNLTVDALARELSYPTWIIEKWVHDLGFSSAVGLALGLNDPAPTTLRTNFLKTDRTKLKRALAKEDVRTEEGKHSPWALHLMSRRNLRALPSFKKGWFEIQDEGSQLAVLETGARIDQTVVDACTGAGGKALALAAMMENTGRIVAVDSDSRPFKELEVRAKRAKAKIIETFWVGADDPEPVCDLKGAADVVLVDAPCSAFGTFRRKPWLKWNLSSHSVDFLPGKQLTLLKRYAQLVKEGGKLVYVTCTVHAKENEDVMTAFLKSENAFRSSESPRHLRPDVEGTDAFFIVCFEK